MSVHTSGPWIWVNDELFPEAEWLAYDAWLQSPETEGKWVGEWCQRPTAIVDTDGGYYGPHDADRPLIAAAPDMLAALKLISLHFKRCLASDQFLGDDEHEAWTAAMNAVAKAEGR